MKYTIRWCDHEGYEVREKQAVDWKTAVELAQELARDYDGVEVLDASGRPVWPFRLEDADL